ncbi:MAG: hypothetical protein IKO00_02010 [Oscillospiraceae bacterium]|nr:hypothetical protein [Oscillospiraceae bacterium]
MVSDFNFYQTVYFGKLLSLEEFPEYATRADAWLSELTFDRYSSPDLSESQLHAVKMAECAVADLWYQLQTEQASNPAISKETVGSHSVTYRTGTEAASSWAARIYDTAARYLMTTGLLYRGAILRFTL